MHRVGIPLKEATSWMVCRSHSISHSISLRNVGMSAGVPSRETACLSQKQVVPRQERALPGLRNAGSIRCEAPGGDAGRIRLDAQRERAA